MALNMRPEPYTELFAYIKHGIAVLANDRPVQDCSGCGKGRQGLADVLELET
jgi:hypothetical protein